MVWKVIVTGGISILLICGLLHLWYTSKSEVSTSFINATSDLKEGGKKQTHPIAQQSRRGKTQKVDLDAYYQIIIDNNIFRPLNYKPPQREQGYTLLGTTIATDSNTGTAYILERKPPGQFRKVKVGDALGESIVQKITPKRVTLSTKKGSTTHLDLSSDIFLNPRHKQSRRSHERVPQVESTTENKTMPIAKSKKGTVTKTDPQRIYEEGIQELMKRANEIRSERARMQERLKYLQQR